MSREELIARAKPEHDKSCSCDPKYIMSCPKMASAILALNHEERVEKALKRIVVEDEELLEKLRSCRNTPCLICYHNGCGWCPDCSPLVPEWD